MPQGPQYIKTVLRDELSRLGCSESLQLRCGWHLVAPKILAPSGGGLGSVGSYLDFGLISDWPCLQSACTPAVVALRPGRVIQSKGMVSEDRFDVPGIP